MNLRDLKNEFKPDLLLPSITAGLIASIITISLEISLAALIFSGDLGQFLAGGIGLMLFGAFVMGIAISLTTSLPGIVGLPQDTPAVIMGLVAASISVSMRGEEPAAVYSTIVAAISLTSVLTAVFFLLLGWFKASGFVRYIPYPVVGGFLAGTGYLLCVGAFGVMVDVPLTPANLPEFFIPDQLINWVPGVLFAVVLLLLLRRWTHFFYHTRRTDHGCIPFLWLPFDRRHFRRGGRQPRLAAWIFPCRWPVPAAHTVRVRFDRLGRDPPEHR